jgi:hypothetical protein
MFKNNPRAFLVREIEVHIWKDGGLTRIITDEFLANF